MIAVRSIVVLLFLCILGHANGQKDTELKAYCETFPNEKSQLCEWYISSLQTLGAGDLSEIARNAHEFSLELIRSAKYQESILYNDLASSIWLQLDSLEQYGYCKAYIGRAKYRLGNIIDAFKQSNEALLIAETHNYLELKSLAHRSLSWNYWRIKQCDDALHHMAFYKKAIDEGVIPISNLSIYYNSMSKFQYCKGNKSLAVQYADSTYYQAMIQDDERLVSIALTNKVSFIMDTASFEEVIGLVNQALDINIKLNDLEQHASNLGLKGKVYNAFGKYEEAISVGLEGLEMSLKIEDKPRIHIAYVLLRRAYAGVGKYKQALEYQLLADEIAVEIYGLKNLDKIFALERENTEEIQRLEIQNLASEQELIELNLNEEKRFYILISIALIVILLMALIGWLKYRQSKEKETEMLKEVYQGQLLKHELKALRAMMNPHFIFNSLNSIKSYIINKESRLATDYLNKFSNLIRQILHNSQFEKISLHEELKGLDLYIQMESMRLESEFNYTINCDPSIDQNKVKIAPLIIQPFVENAIWHGLVNKANNRVLKVDVKQSEDRISIHVIDNGVGRAKAKELSENIPYKRKSFGISITENRINFLSGDGKPKNTLQIKDLMDDSGLPSGTEVIIQINN